MATQIKFVRAVGTIYIRADGSIDPPTAPIFTADNVMYIFTGNIINNSIVVERDNIIIDGLGHTVKGPWPVEFESKGIMLTGRNNVTIRNTTITQFEHGIYLYQSSNSNISRNNVTSNTRLGIRLTQSSNNVILENNSTYNAWGIYLYDSSNNVLKGNNVFHNGLTSGIELQISNNNIISDNNITANNNCGIRISGSSNNIVSGNNITDNLVFGIYLPGSSNNKFYNNDFSRNPVHAAIDPPTSVNVWDDGYASGGNYWSDYAGIDLLNGPFQNETGSDGIGDTPYMIGGNNIDKYPLMYPPWNNMLRLISPQNKNYYANSIPITLGISEKVSWVGYSLDNDLYTTFEGNTTILIEYGRHQIVFCANDTFGDTRFQTVYFSVTIPGDIDGDFTVGLSDLVLLAKSYGTKPGDSNWNPNADVDNNGVVGLTDLVTLARHYGQHYP
jgi:parallel beta-helix repeat protein